MANNMDIQDLLNLSKTELQQLASVISKKNIKMTQKEKNNLLSKISNSDNIKEDTSEISKNMNEMTPQEKIDYRNELKKKLKTKQNNMKNIRKPKYTIKDENKNMEDKLAESINRLSSEINTGNNTNNIDKTNNINNTDNNNISDINNNTSDIENTVENLDDYIVL